MFREFLFQLRSGRNSSGIWCSGQHATTTTYTPSLSPESAFLLLKEIVAAIKNQPSQYSRYTFSQLNSQLLNQTAKGKRSKWRTIIKTYDYRTRARRFWEVVRSLNRTRPLVDRYPVKFGSNSKTDIAKAFNN